MQRAGINPHLPWSINAAILDDDTANPVSCPKGFARLSESAALICNLTSIGALITSIGAVSQRLFRNHHYITLIRKWTSRQGLT